MWRFLRLIKLVVLSEETVTPLQNSAMQISHFALSQRTYFFAARYLAEKCGVDFLNCDEPRNLVEPHSVQESGSTVYSHPTVIDHCLSELSETLER